MCRKRDGDRRLEEVVLRSGGGGNHCIPAQNARDPEAELSRVAIGNGRVECLRPHTGIRHQTEKVSPGRTSVLHNLQSSSTTCDPSPPRPPLHVVN